MNALNAVIEAVFTVSVKNVITGTVVGSVLMSVVMIAVSF